MCLTPLDLTYLKHRQQKKQQLFRRQRKVYFVAFFPFNSETFQTSNKGCVRPKISVTIQTIKHKKQLNAVISCLEFSSVLLNFLFIYIISNSILFIVLWIYSTVRPSENKLCLRRSSPHFKKKCITSHINHDSV